MNTETADLKIASNQGVTERGNKNMKLLSTYLDPEVFKDFKIRCTLEGRSMTKVVEEMIREFIKKRGKG